MAVVAIALLVLGVSGTIVRPWRLAAWLFPVTAAGLALVVGVIGPADVLSAVDPLVEPIAFLLLAVPSPSLSTSSACSLQRRQSWPVGDWPLACG